jgi:uracil-DNA glycosylase, family 4
MFVGEAPGFHEDKQGVPFVGAAGKLLGKLLEGIGMTRDDVYVANVLKCRPPGNRDPLPDEIASCEPHLFKQIELIQPKLIATLGNFATKLLSGKPNGITQVHGREQRVTLGGQSVVLYPIFHPGRRALHAADARGAGGGLPPHPRADRARRRAASAACRTGAGARAPGPARPLLTETTTASPAETEALAARLAARLRPATSSRSRASWGGQDDLRPRRGSGPRRDGAGGQPDLHDRHCYEAPTPVAHLDLYRLAGIDAPSGAIWSPTSTARSPSSNGPSTGATGSRQPGPSLPSSTWTRRTGASRLR